MKLQFAGMRHVPSGNERCDDCRWARRVLRASRDQRRARSLAGIHLGPALRAEHSCSPVQEAMSLAAGSHECLPDARSAMDMDEEEDDETLLVGCAGALYKRTDFLDKEEVSACRRQHRELVEWDGRAGRQGLATSAGAVQKRCH